MLITLEHYLFLASIIFTIGILGIFLNKKNLIIILMSIVAMLTLTVAAAEAAIGLAILVVFFRNLGSIEVNKINKLKG